MRKIIPLVLLFLFSFVYEFKAFSQTYFTESFETEFTPNTAVGPNAPSGWAQTRLGTLTSAPGTPGTSSQRDWARTVWSGTAWASNTLPNVNQVPYTTGTSGPSGAQDGTSALWFNDGYAAGSSTSGQNIRRIETPSVNLTSATSPIINFYHSQNISAAVLTVLGSLDGGVTWNTLATYGSTSTWAWVQRFVSIPATYKIANAKFALQVSNTWGSYDVFIDNFKVREGVAPTVPTTFATTLVTNSSMTVGWTDNSTNETAFRVYRSTDNINFTQVGTDITSTSAATTGTTYTQAQTGLFANTTYYFRVVAVYEAESLALTGSQATLAPGNFVSTTTGGLWGSTATWVGGVVPSTNDNVTIADGAIVTMDAAYTVNSLTLGQGASGILQWGSTSYALTVQNDVTVAAGGKLFAYTTGGTGQTINVGGNFTNNGYVNLALLSAYLNFNGSQQGTSLSQTLGGSGSFQGNGTSGIINQLFFQTTGSSTITTSQNLITRSFAHTAGSLNTNGKLTIDNTAQVFGQTLNTQVANVVVTAMGSAFTNQPVVFGATATLWTASGTSTLNTRYFYGNNVYIATTAGTFDATTAPTHTSGSVTNGTTPLLWLGTLGTIGTPFQQTAVTVGTQYFYGSNLYVCTVAGTPSATAPPVHTSGAVASGTATFLYVGTAATVTMNYDATSKTIRSLNLTSSGNGYSSAPTVVFSLNGGTGTVGTATAVVLQSILGSTSATTQVSGVATLTGALSINSTQGATAYSGVGGITTTNGGVNYTVAPTVGFSGPTAINLVTNGGSGYTTAPTVNVTGGTLVSGTAYTSSSFTVTVANGQVVSVYLTGTGVYSNPPILSFSTGSATLAFPSGCWPAATANIGANGQITSFTITNSGFGYVAAPTVGIGATSGTALGGTFTTVATTPTCRIALYNLTCGFFTPAASNVANNIATYIPANGKLNSIIMNSALGATLASNLELFASSPITLTNGKLDLGSNTLTFSNASYAGASGSSTASVSGKIVLSTPGGSLTRTFPYEAPFAVVAGTGSLATGSTITKLTVTRTGAPSGTVNVSGQVKGQRAYRVQAVGTYGTNPTVTLNYNATDALTGVDNSSLYIGQSTALTGAWDIRSISSGTGVLSATGSRTTATTGVGPIVPTGDDYFAWIGADVVAPTITLGTLSNTTICTSNRTITATITDASGVNVTPGLKPRLWFKKSIENDVLPATNTSASNGWKWVEATNNTSPFSFTFNFNLLNSPLNVGDSVSYFIVAQDSAGTPNVGASIVTFTAAPSSVALSGGSFPTSGSIKGYIVANPPVPLLVKTNKSEACKKDRVILDVDGVVVDGGEFQWQSSPSGANTFTNIVGATTVPYTTDSLTTSTDFRLVVSCGGTPIASSPSTVATFIVNNPQVSSTTPATRCGTGTVNLSATAPGYDINWYANATGGAPIGTGNTFTTPVINNTTTYYVGAASGGSTFSVGLPDNNSSYGTFGNPSGFGYGLYFTTTSGMTINSVFVYPQGAGTCTIQLQDGTGALISGQQYIATFTTADVGVKTLVPVNFIIPSGGSYRLMNTAGTAYLGRFNPYSGTAYPLSYGSGAIILTQGSVSTTTYYSFFDWSVTTSCEGTRTAVTATVTAPTTIIPSSPNAIICSGSSATLNVSSSNSGYVYTWTPGSSLTGASVSVSPTTTTKYYVNANDAGTSCSAVDSITITVQPNPTVGAIPPSFCAAGGSSVISLNPSTGYGTGSIQWQSSPNNISFSDISGANTVTYTTPTITATTYYKALIKDGLGVTCSAPVATIGVYNPIVATTTPATRCGVGTVTLGATQTGGNSLNWYAAATGGAPIGSGTSFTTPSISTSTTYYVAATSGGASGSSPVGTGATTSATYSNPFYSLWSNTHNQHIILASELLAAGLTTGYITGLGLDVTSAGTLPMIDFSLKLGTTSATTMSAFVPSSGFTTVYTSASLMPTTGINTLTFTTPFFWDGGSNIVVEICHGNSASTATMSRTVKADITSYVSTIHTNTSAATAASVQCGDNTTGLTTYSVRPQFYFTYINGCESARTAVSASIVSPPAITKSATPAAVCAGQSSSLSVSSTNSGYTYLWTPGNLTGASQTVTPTTTTKYYVAATDASGGTYNGCSNIDSITVTVNPVPSSISIIASATTICNTTGSAALLTANGGTIPSTGYVGTGTTQNSSSGTTNMPPYAANYTGGRHQILVLASELTAAGLIPGSKISSLAFDVVSNASTVGYQNFVIKIGSTTATALTTTFETSATTEVYNAPSFTPSVGWSEHTFSAPFTWDGTSNLLVETYFSNCGNTSASSCSGTTCTGYGSGITWSQNAVTNQSATSFVSHSYFYSDGSSCNIQTQATASTSVSVRPNMRFTASVPTTFAWSPLTGLYIDAAATTAYTGTNLTSVYAKPSVTTLYTATSSTSVPCSTSGTQNIVVDCSSVPVTLLNFNGERRTGYNILSWTTATEVNNAGFELERSNDGLSFSKIASIASKSANGNSNQQLSYSFNDYNQLIVNAYYRLKQLDKNGKFYYSAVVLIKAGKATQIEIVSIYPNPVKNELNIKIASPLNDKVELQLTDVSGKVLVRREVSLMSGDNVFNIPVAQFAQGVYLIKTICANGCESAVKKFVKE